MIAQNTNQQDSQDTKAIAHQTAYDEIQFYAMPYNIDATGYYFSTADEFTEKSTVLRDRYDNPVEEYEIQFIDGTSEQADLFKACNISQTNIGEFLSMLDAAFDYQLPALFYLCDNHGYSMDDALDQIDDVCVYEGNLLDAATELFGECYAHTIPENLRYYINYEAFANDCRCGGDMTEFEFAGTTYTCTNSNCL